MQQADREDQEIDIICMGARGMGKSCVCGAGAHNIDYGQQQCSVNGTTVTKGEWVTVDGSTGASSSGACRPTSRRSAKISVS